MNQSNNPEALLEQVVIVDGQFEGVVKSIGRDGLYVLFEGHMRSMWCAWEKTELVLDRLIAQANTADELNESILTKIGYSVKRQAKDKSKNILGGYFCVSSSDEEFELYGNKGDAISDCLGDIDLDAECAGVAFTQDEKDFLVNYHGVGEPECNLDLLGTHVTWTSSNTEKTGEVLAFIPAGISVAFIRVFYDLNIDYRKTKISQPVSMIDRFLVIVRRTSKNGKPLEPHYYAASASVVLKAIEACE
jgi:hypothetical protein